jgi:adenine phosphoribosyltransferase
LLRFGRKLFVSCIIPTLIPLNEQIHCKIFLLEYNKGFDKKQHISSRDAVQKGFAMSNETVDLSQFIRNIPDFPKPGILFRDITPLLADARALEKSIEVLAEPFMEAGIDVVAAVEARGFIFGSAVAKTLGAGFVPIRKKGKLPFQTHSVSYGLEYGTDSVEVHSDAVAPGTKVLMVDDLLATGGTMAAACELVENLGGEIAGLTFLIELADLKGREKFSRYNIHTVITY